MSLKVLLVNTADRTGGAAIAAMRLLDALNRNGVQAKLLVRDRQTDRPDVIGLGEDLLHRLPFYEERLAIWRRNHFKRENLFAVDVARYGIDITSLPEYREADVIHLHWVNQGMLSLPILHKILQSGKRVVWTMHDMWPFTGICHYVRECDHYKEACHDCMYLNGQGGLHDISYRTFQAKEKLYQTAPIAFVACSRWLEQMARGSYLLQHQDVRNIPNAIDTRIYHPTDMAEARALLHLPAKGKLLLFGSVKVTDERKGLAYFMEACRLLHEKHPELQKELGVAVFGNQSQVLEHALPYPIYPLGFIRGDSRLVALYNAADLFVIPSLEDNLPNTIMESMACGTPCVGFDVGGIPEMIDHQRNGYVAKYRSAEDFAEGIYETLCNPQAEAWSAEAVRKVKTNYSQETVAKKYIEVYNHE